MTREMVRLHRQHPQLSVIVSKYDPDYLADILARYLITNTGGPHRYDGPPLAETHAHLHITEEQYMAGGGDLAAAMKNVGLGESEILDVNCFLLPLAGQIVSE